jgi:hypothetical protein
MVISKNKKSKTNVFINTGSLVMINKAYQGKMLIIGDTN